MVSKKMLAKDLIDSSFRVVMDLNMVRFGLISMSGNDSCGFEDSV